MTRRSSLLAAALCCLCAIASAPAASSADIGEEINYRCGHGESLAGFTVKQYQRALKELTADTEALEYSSCAEEIQRALNAAASHKAAGSGGTGAGAAGGAGGAPSATVQPTPEQVRTLEQTRNSGPAPVELGDGRGAVVPGVVHANLGSATSNLPTPALVVIALVLAGLALLAVREAKERLQRSRSH
jgi:hypothetical protein